MTAMAKNQVTDTELDEMLKAATRPQLPRGFADRLQAKLEQPAASNVIAFPQKKTLPVKSARLWLSAIPLAASLVIGLYLGAQGSMSESFDGFGTSLVSDASDQTLDLGIEDTESFVNGELS
jgi:hypothetical protein